RVARREQRRVVRFDLAAQFGWRSLRIELGLLGQHLVLREQLGEARVRRAQLDDDGLDLVGLGLAVRRFRRKARQPATVVAFGGAAAVGGAVGALGTRRGGRGERRDDRGSGECPTGATGDGQAGHAPQRYPRRVRRQRTKCARFGGWRVRATRDRAATPQRPTRGARKRGSTRQRPRTRHRRAIGSASPVGVAARASSNVSTMRFAGGVSSPSPLATPPVPAPASRSTRSPYPTQTRSVVPAARSATRAAQPTKISRPKPSNARPGATTASAPPPSSSTVTARPSTTPAPTSARLRRSMRSRT